VYIIVALDIILAMQIVTIIGCRNDQQVTQIRKYDKFGCVSSTEYTDGIIGDA